MLRLISDPGCPKGKWAEELQDEYNETIGFTCKVCPVDTYTGMAGLYANCVSCNTTTNPSGTLPGTTTALYRQKCLSKYTQGPKVIPQNYFSIDFNAFTCY